MMMIDDGNSYDASFDILSEDAHTHRHTHTHTHRNASQHFWLTRHVTEHAPVLCPRHVRNELRSPLLPYLALQQQSVGFNFTES